MLLWKSHKPHYVKSRLLLHVEARRSVWLSRKRYHIKFCGYSHRTNIGGKKRELCNNKIS